MKNLNRDYVAYEVKKNVGSIDNWWNILQNQYFKHAALKLYSGVKIMAT